jgi:hypothetical protein
VLEFLQPFGLLGDELAVDGCEGGLKLRATSFGT